MTEMGREGMNSTHTLLTAAVQDRVNLVSEVKTKGFGVFLVCWR